MPADDYTPSYECVPEGQRILDDDDARYEYGFTPKRLLDYDRWMAAHDARVRAEAVEDAADWLDGFKGPGGRTSLHDQVGRDLIRLLRERARADTITQEDTP